MSKEILKITIYLDINKAHKVEIYGEQPIYTIDQNSLYEYIREAIKVRLQVNHEEIIKQMKEKGAIKSI